jgi:4-amino-4-deoxychorismate lyase
MCLLVETIRIIDGNPINLLWHQKRMDISVKQIFKVKNTLKLESLITVPAIYTSGTVKFRIVYDPQSYSTEFSFYKPVNITSLKLVECDSINYEHKYNDRKSIEDLKNQRGTSDDVLIIKNGFLSDTSYSNIIFFNGKKWFTPSTPLLNGTCRQRLLKEGKISEIPLKPEELKDFQSFQLINAMLDFDAYRAIDISNVCY